MKIGILGTGKLGLPVALAIDSKGHTVYAYDVSPDPLKYLKKRQIPYKEEGSKDLLKRHNIVPCVSTREMVEHSEIIFVPVQTPHHPMYEGITRIPEERADFDYTFLTHAVRELNKLIRRPTVVAIISTVLPGTIEREIIPLITNPQFKLAYNPSFIAMGTVISDFLDPEFVLMGGETEKLREFYRTLHHKPILETDIKTAEGIKVLYNTFITTKTVLGNLYGELAHKTGMNVDDIHKALKMSTDRLLSPKYLRAGVGDGGGCHPRDNIALSYLADKVDLSFNFFDALMKARENHMDWLAGLIKTKLPVVILGRSFKPETNIETGSAAILLSNLLTERGVKFKHVEDLKPMKKALYFIGTAHDRYKNLKFPRGSVVIDPFGIIEDRPGVDITRIGRTNWGGEQISPKVAH